MHKRKKRIRNHDHKKRSRHEIAMKKTIKTNGERNRHRTITKKISRTTG
jgi:hypothetical protein